MGETWFFIAIISLSIVALFKAFLNLFLPTTTTNTATTLPPRPLSFIASLLWLKKSSFRYIGPIIHSFHAQFGPIITLRIGTKHHIYVADGHLAYQALVQNGAVLANRPSPTNTDRIISSNQHTISFSYGPTWRLLRRNLVSEMLRPSVVKSYSKARKWALQIFLNRLENRDMGSDIDFRHPIFSLLFFMCFGYKLDDQQEMEEMRRLQHSIFLNSRNPRFYILNILPLRLSEFMFSKRWSEFLQLRKNLQEGFLPFIRARKKEREFRLGKEDKDDEFILSYVDTLLDLQLPDEKRKLNEEELVNLCDEFFNGGTETTSSALQWIMANLVKHPQIQEKLFTEMKMVVGKEEKEVIEEEDLNKMKYLKAVILEGLRRYPPTQFLLPHEVSDDIVLGNFFVPKNWILNCVVTDIGRDPKVWDDPMEFKPERFSGNEEFDIKGNKEIKMIPFGAGRRICPGYNLGMLHLQYFVANLVWKYEWKAVEGDEIDLSEKAGVTLEMKNPLKAHLFPRFKKTVI